MAHTFISHFVHGIFSTKGRLPAIRASWRPQLHSFLGGIARKNGMTPLAVGGVEDHVHILVSLLATLALAKAMQLLKGGSSAWVHETIPIARPSPGKKATVPSA